MRRTVDTCAAAAPQRKSTSAAVGKPTFCVSSLGEPSQRGWSLDARLAAGRIGPLVRQVATDVAPRLSGGHPHGVLPGRLVRPSLGLREAAPGNSVQNDSRTSGNRRRGSGDGCNRLHSPLQSTRTDRGSIEHGQRVRALRLRPCSWVDRSTRAKTESFRAVAESFPGAPSRHRGHRVGLLAECQRSVSSPQASLPISIGGGGKSTPS